ARCGRWANFIVRCQLKAGVFRRLVNLWPPLLFAGIRAKVIRADYRYVEVVMKLRWYNRNYVGVHFGGSLFAMTDPWFMLMLMHNLGREYYVWDKQGAVDYIAPGRGIVTAHFQIDDDILDEIKTRTANGEKYLPEFHIEIRDEQQQVIARVHRVLYVRKKPAARSA
ncbi:MAG TPA: DUF4442 domain-containing protein, partial [Cellvibrio sp.]|nr:DUF4442 domain-containing protein [Cellvibrio sp.]